MCSYGLSDNEAWNWRYGVIVGEYMGAQVHRTGGRQDVRFGGGYVYVAYFLTGEHTPWEKSSGTLGGTKPFANFSPAHHHEAGMARG